MGWSHKAAIQLFCHSVIASCCAVKRSSDFAGGSGGRVGPWCAVSAVMALSRRRGIDPLVAGSQPKLICNDG